MMNKLRRNVWALGPGLLLSALVVTFTPGTASADVIRLKTGEIVKGRPVEALSTDTLCVIEDAKTGNLRKFRWEVIEPADRDRLLKAWGRLPPTIEPVNGHIVVMALEGGFLDEVHGLVVDRDKAKVFVMSFGRRLELDASRVREIRESKLDPRVIWTPDQLVNARLGELPNAMRDEKGMPTSRGHLQVARYAEVVGAYARALQHYREAARDEKAPHHKFARQKEAEMKVLRQDEDVLALLRDVRMAIQVRLFAEARERLEAIEAAWPNPSKELAKRIAETKRYFDERREDYFAREVSRILPKLARKLIDAKVAEKNVRITDVVSWTRVGLPEELFEAVIERFQKRDVLTAEDARAAWGRRKRRSWRTVSFGSGTFIVRPPSPRPPPKRPKKKKKSERGPVFTLPKPPTRDEWWEKVDRKMRASFVMAYFVQNSGLFELGGEKDVACARCEGSGEETRRLQNGNIVRFLCLRCAGARTDLVLRYR